MIFPVRPVQKTLRTGLLLSNIHKSFEFVSQFEATRPYYQEKTARTG
jgi:hypothetical protein